MTGEQDPEQARGHPQNADQSCNRSFLQEFCSRDRLFAMIFTFACGSILSYFCPLFPRDIWGLFTIMFSAVVAINAVSTYDYRKLKFPSVGGSKKHRLHWMAGVVYILVYRTTMLLIFCTLPQFKIYSDLGWLGRSLMFKQNSSDLEQSNNFIRIIMKLFGWFLLVTQIMYLLLTELKGQFESHSQIMFSLLTELKDEFDSSSAYDGSRSSSSRQALGTSLNEMAGLLLLWSISRSGSVNSGFGRPGRSLMSKQQKGYGSVESNNFVDSLIGVFVCFTLTVHFIVVLWTELNYLFDSSSADNGSSSSTQQQALAVAGDTGPGSSFPITDLFPSYSPSTSGAGALVFTQPPETDNGNGGVLNPVDQINHVDVAASSSTNHDLGNLLVFTPLEEEEEECLWEQIPEYMMTAESDSAVMQVKTMPTPSLQTDLQTNKNITAPSSSSCSRQTYWPHVHQDITTISESTTQHINLVQEYSRETEINLSMNEKLDSSLQGIQISQQPSSSVIHSEAFQHAGVISVEFDPTNTGGEVVNIHNNFTPQANSEIKSTIHTCEITSQDLQKVVGLKRSDAAKTLGVSVSTFKRISRHYKISKWPDYRNIKQCSVLKEKLKIQSIQAAEGPPTRSSHTEGVGSSHQNSPGFEPEPQEEKTTLSPCKILSTAGQNDNLQSSKDLTNPCSLAVEVAMQEAKGAREFSGAILTDPALEQDLATFPPTVPNVRRMLDARTWTIKATYGKYKLRFQLFSTKIAELKEEVAKRLQLELNSFDIQYEDDDKEWILIACDEDLEVCLNFFSSMGNQKTTLLITDKNCQLIS